MAVRNPRPPTFTGNSGISRRPIARAAESSVPSPPRTMIRSQPSGPSSCGMGGAPAYAPESSSSRTAMPRCFSHAMISGTILPACSEPGLETIPTVLMTGMQQKLLVSFRAVDGTLHHAGGEPEFFDGRSNAVACGPMQRRVAHNATLSDLALANFELRLDQYNHLPLRLEQRNDGRQNQC